MTKQHVEGKKEKENPLSAYICAFHSRVNLRCEVAHRVEEDALGEHAVGRGRTHVDRGARVVGREGAVHLGGGERKREKEKMETW